MFPYRNDPLASCTPKVNSKNRQRIVHKLQQSTQNRGFTSKKQACRAAGRRFFSVNRDIFFRTVCLVAVTTFFTSTGARQGDVVLAVNTLLMQLFTLFSYIMDGFAYAGEALSGLYIGARNRSSFARMIRYLFVWGVALSTLFTLLYAWGGHSFLSLLTDDEAVVHESARYFYWVLAVPFAGFAAFLWDGILIGATETKGMLYAMVVAAGGFFLLYDSLVCRLGNHALWMAFLFYLVLRGVVQTVWAQRIFGTDSKSG